MFSIIDCGTTNTRVYILDDSYRIIGKGARKAGVRDTAITGSKNVLQDGIKEAFFIALKEANARLEDIKFAIASGMITSELGLIDIPHITAPAGLDEISQSVVVVQDTSVFPLDIPVMFIRGIKNNYGSTGLSGIRSIDFMRGEETQVIGILKELGAKVPLNVIVLSSHTKLIHIDQEEKIAGSITTISGQIYEAVKKETSIGKCFIGEKNGYSEEFFSKEILNIAYDSVTKSGFLRTLLMPRFMEVLLQTNWYERKFFVDCAIASEDMKILNEAKGLMGFNLDTDFILVGNVERCRIYDHLIRNIEGFKGSILSISDIYKVDMLAINGAVEIAKNAKKFLNS